MTHSEMRYLISWEIDIIDSLRFNNDADFLYRLATTLKIWPNDEYWCKCTWQTSGVNKTATSDWLDLCWQLGFQSERYWASFSFFKSLDCFTMRLFHSAAIFCCYICMYLLFEASPGLLPAWRGFFCLNFGGGHSAPMYLLFVLYTDL